MSEPPVLPRFIAVAAIDESRGLGIKGDLPWHLPGDLKHFAKTTTQTTDPTQKNAVIMGRVTCETIPEKYWPLPGRHNVVITRNRDFAIDGADVFTDLPSALLDVRDKVETIYLVGGGQIYSLGIELDACEELILTRIHRDFGCDAFFPQYQDRFSLAEELGQGEHKGLRYVIERWQRNVDAATVGTASDQQVLHEQ